MATYTKKVATHRNQLCLLHMLLYPPLNDTFKQLFRGVWSSVVRPFWDSSLQRWRFKKCKILLISSLNQIRLYNLFYTTTSWCLMLWVCFARVSSRKADDTRQTAGHGSKSYVVKQKFKAVIVEKDSDDEARCSCKRNKVVCHCSWCRKHFNHIIVGYRRLDVWILLKTVVGLYDKYDTVQTNVCLILSNVRIMYCKCIYICYSGVMWCTLQVCWLHSSPTSLIHVNDFES